MAASSRNQLDWKLNSENNDIGNVFAIKQQQQSNTSLIAGKHGFTKPKQAFGDVKNVMAMTPKTPANKMNIPQQLKPPMKKTIPKFTTRTANVFTDDDFCWDYPPHKCPPEKSKSFDLFDSFVLTDDEINKIIYHKEPEKSPPPPLKEEDFEFEELDVHGGIGITGNTSFTLDNLPELDHFHIPYDIEFDD